MGPDPEPIRVFIGSGEASLVERKTLIYSIRKHARRPVDIYVFNGTHNAIELNDGEPWPAAMPLRVKYRNTTEFSLYRFLIPEVCRFRGRAIYLDSDMVCLADIGQLFDAPLGECDFLAKKDAYLGGEQWGLSAMLIDCDRCRFDLDKMIAGVDRGLYSLVDMMQMAAPFLAHNAYRIGALDPHWNVFDQYDAHTKLIHYTNLYTQPWKYHDHPQGELWFRYLREAMAGGHITPRDVELTKLRSYVRADLLDGNWSRRGRVRELVRALAPRMRRVEDGARARPGSGRPDAGGSGPR